MARDLRKLSDDELVAENQRLMAKRDEIRAQQLAVKEVLDERDAARRAELALEGMSDVQIDALAAAASAKRES